MTLTVTVLIFLPIQYLPLEKFLSPKYFWVMPLRETIHCQLHTGCTHRIYIGALMMRAIWLEWTINGCVIRHSKQHEPIYAVYTIAPLYINPKLLIPYNDLHYPLNMVIERYTQMYIHILPESFKMQFDDVICCWLHLRHHRQPKRELYLYDGDHC